MDARTPFSAYARLLGLVRGHRLLILAFVSTTLLASAVEGLSVGMLASLMQNWGSSQATLATSVPLPVGTLAGMLASFEAWLRDMPMVHRVRWFAVGLFVVVVIKSSLNYLDRLMALRLQVRLDLALKQATVRQLYRLSWPFVQQHSSGDLLTVFMLQTRQTANMVATLATAIANASILLVYGLLMICMSWPLTLFAVALLVLLAAINLGCTSKRLREEGQIQLFHHKRLRQIVIESLGLMKLSHLYVQEEQGIARCNSAAAKLLQHFYNSERLIQRAAPIFNISAVTGFCLLLLAGTFILPTQTELWLGQTMLFLAIVLRLLAPATAVHRAQAEWKNGHASLESILEFLDEHGKPYLKNGSTRFAQLRDGIRFENVSFAYAPNLPRVLDGISFEIPRGKVTAIVGPSGAGKSTIVDLLARLIDCDQGAIRIDQCDLRELDLHDWRKKIALVSQESLLCTGSVKENLRLARPQATDQEIQAVARRVQIDQRIGCLPQGYDTPLGERGSKLSGGEQQRIAIARALLADPQLLILDEATSALDSESERLMQEALREFAQDRTLLVVAHRLATVQTADRILVLDHGHIVEQGTHPQLLHQEGLYRQLVEAQTFTTAHI